MEKDYSLSRLDKAKVISRRFRKLSLPTDERTLRKERATIRKRRSIRTIGKTNRSHILF